MATSLDASQGFRLRTSRNGSRGFRKRIFGRVVLDERSNLLYFRTTAFVYFAGALKFASIHRVYPVFAWADRPVRLVHVRLLYCGGIPFHLWAKQSGLAHASRGYSLHMLRTRAQALHIQFQLLWNLAQNPWTPLLLHPFFFSKPAASVKSSRNPRALQGSSKDAVSWWILRTEASHRSLLVRPGPIKVAAADAACIMFPA